MKKRRVLVAILTLTTLCSSVASDNLRIGLALGGAFHRTYVKTELELGKDKVTTSSVAAGVFVGYDYHIKETPLFLGAELALTNHNAEKEQYLICSPYSAGSFKLKTNNSLTGVLRFGVIANQTGNDILLYGKAGLSSTNWTTTVKEQDEYQNSFQKYGLVTGFGMDSKVSQNFSIGWEHQYTFNSEMRRIHPTIKLKTKPIVQITSMRITYSF